MGWSRCIALCFLAAGRLMLAADITVSGQVLDTAGAIIPNASVQLFADRRPLTPVPDPVRPTGEFSIILRSLPDVSQLRAQFSAPGFISQTRNLIFVNNLAKVGIVRLSRAPGLQLGHLQVTISGDQKISILTLSAENQSSKSIEVISTSLKGTARRQTSCLDFRPDLIFKIADEFGLRHASVAVRALVRIARASGLQ
jgi:hypothetical protein